MRKPSAKDRGKALAFYAVCTAFAVVFLAPLLWGLYSSLFGSRASQGQGGFGLANYQRLSDYGVGLEVYLWNTTVMTFIAVLGTVVVTVLGGYALARFSFPGKNFLFIGALAILMIPHPTILVPLYQMANWVGGQNSLASVAVVLIMFQLPFGLFMMRNAFAALPRELEEAALLDGCSYWGALWHILLRAVVPAAITVGLFAFLAAWNEFLVPLIFLADGSKFTLPVALVSLRAGEFGSVDLGALQAGIVVSAIPCVLLFLFLQKYYVRGFTAGSVRG